MKLHDEWHWIVNHAWSSRFIALAFVLSIAETFLPVFVTTTRFNHIAYAALMSLVAGAAYVARLVAQERPK